MDELKGLLSGAGKQLFDRAGQAIGAAATEYIGSVINEIFEKKETDTKRILPSIRNMKVIFRNRFQSGQSCHSLA